MTPKQKSVIEQALNSLQVQVSYDDYESLGRIMTVKRRLGELLGEATLASHLLPHEDMESMEFQEMARSLEGQTMTEYERKELSYILEIANRINGYGDSDAACVRCGTRMLAELTGEHLPAYRLLYEKEVKPLYYSPE